MAETLNERDLVEKLRQSDPAAFKILYEKYAPRLKAFSTRFNFTLPESEDIVQETFIKIWKTRDTINPDTSFNTFLITIAKHLIYNQLRHSTYRKKYRNEISLLSQQSTSLGNEKDLQELIEKTITKLPDKCQQIYRKSRMDGYTNSEIAREMSVTKSTVENQLNKALKKLKNQLRNAGYGSLSVLIMDFGFHGLFTIH